MSAATLRVAYLEIGRLRRRELLAFFAVARSKGCSVTYREDRGFLNSLFTNVVISGPEIKVRSLSHSMRMMIDWED